MTETTVQMILRNRSLVQDGSSVVLSEQANVKLSTSLVYDIVWGVVRAWGGRHGLQQRAIAVVKVKPLGAALNIRTGATTGIEHLLFKLHDASRRATLQKETDWQDHTRCIQFTGADLQLHATSEHNGKGDRVEIVVGE